MEENLDNVFTNFIEWAKSKKYNDYSINYVKNIFKSEPIGNNEVVIKTVKTKMHKYQTKEMQTRFIYSEFCGMLKLLEKTKIDSSLNIERLVFTFNMFYESLVFNLEIQKTMLTDLRRIFDERYNVRQNYVRILKQEESNKCLFDSLKEYLNNQDNEVFEDIFDLVFNYGTLVEYMHYLKIVERVGAYFTYKIYNLQFSDSKHVTRVFNSYLFFIKFLYEKKMISKNEYKKYKKTVELDEILVEYNIYKASNY